MFQVRAGLTQQSDGPAMPKIQGPALVLSFEGGLPGNTVAEVLTVLLKYPEFLKQPEVLRATHTAKRGDTVCLVLGNRNYPLPCGDSIRDVITLLNPELKTTKGELRLGQTITVPSPPIYKYPITSYYTKEQPIETTKAEISKAEAAVDEMVLRWKGHLNASQVDEGPRYKLVRYDGYRMVLETKSTEAALELAKLLTPVRKDPANLRFDLVEERPIGKLQSAPTTVTEWEKECTSGSLFQSPRQYGDLIVSDLSAVENIDKSIPVAPVRVTIVDVRVNEAPILSAAPPGTILGCNWTKYIPALHHATHMAAIIASRHGALGFIGLAPHAKIESFELLVSDYGQPEPKAIFKSGQEFELGDKIAGVSIANPLRVYLIATQFPPSKLSVDVYGRGGSLGQRMSESRSLFVVAAGQEKAPLSATGTMFPQTLGDYRNVIVVTACNPCSLTSPKLMPETNFTQTKNGRAAVHIAAPGGAPIAAWVDDKSVSATPGTSQAAAYVAGVAAAMIGRYKDVYTSPEAVKRRLQVTSQPSQWQVDDAPKVGMGIVDPVLALLDPRKHWLKDQNGWRAIKIKALAPDKQVKAREMIYGTDRTFKEVKVRRIVRTVDGAPSDYQWDLYEEPWRVSKQDGNHATLERVSNLTFSSGPIVLCDNTTVVWSQVADLILAEGDSDEASCS